MSTSIKVEQLKEARDWLKKNTKKLLLFGFLTFMVLSLAALTSGIGYEARSDVTSIRLRDENHPCYGCYVIGRVTCSFNPFLYPVSHILGYEANSMFAGVSEPYDNTGESVKERNTFWVAFHEFLKNFPYYLAISIIVACGLSKLTHALLSSIEQPIP